MTLFSDLQMWLLPPRVNILLIIMGVIVWLLAPRAGRVITGIGILSLWLFSTPFIAYHMIGSLQNQYAMLDPESANKNQSPDAILVLGGDGSVYDEYRHGYTVSDVTLQRLKYAAYLRQKTHLPIIVSGSKTSGSQATEADIMSRYLQENDNIIVAFKDEKGQTDEGQRPYFISMFKQKHIDSIYLVTNGWNMARSQFIFECAGINVIPAPMGYEEGFGDTLDNLTPNRHALDMSAVAIREFVARYWYQMKQGSRCEA